jgi:hypothetical protein
MSYELERLLIRNALIDNYNDYAEGIDSKNWPLVRSCFAEEVLIDYGDISAATGSPDVPRRIDDWMQHLRSVINGFDITRHTITNHRVAVAGDEVCCRACLLADHVVFADPKNTQVSDDDVVTVVGEYTNHYRRIGDSWKICRSQLVVNWTRGNLALFDSAPERAARSGL